MHIWPWLPNDLVHPLTVLGAVNGHHYQHPALLVRSGPCGSVPASEGGPCWVTVSTWCSGWPLLLLTDSTYLFPKIWTNLNQQWLNLYPQRKAINVWYNVIPRNFRYRKTFCLKHRLSPHDLITSQAASGKDSGGRDVLAYHGHGKCLPGYRWGLHSGLSKAELPPRLSTVLVGFKTGSADFLWSNEQGHTHQVMPWGHYQQSLTSDLDKAFLRSDLHLLLGAAYVWMLQVAYIHWAFSAHTEAWLI